VKLVMPLRVSPGDMAECVRLQAAELFALCEAEGFIPTNESSVSSLFVASRGPQRSEVFRSQRSVCASPAIRPITKQKFAMFVIIEEKLKLVYCAIPKVRHRTEQSPEVKVRAQSRAGSEKVSYITEQRGRASAGFAQGQKAFLSFADGALCDTL